MTTEILNEKIIAPCGMDCTICRAHLRVKNPCPGCNFSDENKPKTRTNCKIKNCTERKGEFCFDGDKFPCELLERLDTRYCTKYGMSQIANLKSIRDFGMDKLLETEEKKWLSKKGILCVHDRKYY